MTGALVPGMGGLAMLALLQDWPARDALVCGYAALLSALVVARMSVEHRSTRGASGLLPWSGWIFALLACAVLIGLAGFASARVTAMLFVALVAACIDISLRRPDRPGVERDAERPAGTIQGAIRRG